MANVYTPSTVLAIAAAFLFIGVVVGFGVFALAHAASRSDIEMDHAEKLLRLSSPVCWRYRPGPTAKWIYDEDPTHVAMVPAYWQCQSLGMIANMVDIDAPYTGGPSTRKEQA